MSFILVDLYIILRICMPMRDDGGYDTRKMFF